jgi:hypothetical protein
MKVSKFFDLTIPAPKRLEMMREAYANFDIKYPNCPEHAKPKSWRDIRGTTHKGLPAYVGALSRGFNDGCPVWYTHGATGLRDEKTDSAYWTDANYVAEARGLIVKLPHGRYLAGYYWTENGESVIFPDIYETREDAEAGADYEARKFADCAFSDSQRFEEMKEIEWKIEQKIERLRECRALSNINFRREAMRGECREIIADIRELRYRLKNEFSDFM